MPVPEVSTGLSLIVIMGILTITVVASLLSPKGREVARKGGPEQVAEGQSGDGSAPADAPDSASSSRSEFPSGDEDGDQR